MEDTTKKFVEEVLSKAEAALENPTEILEEIPGKRTPIKIGMIEHNGETYKVMTQNLRKPSKFAKLGLNGHSVCWVISEEGEWYLIVDGKWTKKSKVTADGQLMEGAVIG